LIVASSIPTVVFETTIHLQFGGGSATSRVFPRTRAGTLPLVSRSNAVWSPTDAAASPAGRPFAATPSGASEWFRQNRDEHHGTGAGL
jgi:hypothetical protein